MDSSAIHGGWLRITEGGRECYYSQNLYLNFPKIFFCAILIDVACACAQK